MLIFHALAEELQLFLIEVYGIGLVVEAAVMKNITLGWIGVVWGGLVLLSGFAKILSGGMGGSAYGAGQLAGFIFGGLLCLAGVYTLRKKPKV